MPGVFFDTSRVEHVDLLDLIRQVAPQQILFATDYPYGRQPNSLLLALRTARASGLDEAELRAMLGDSAARIADGLDPVTPGGAQGADRDVPAVPFLRIHQYLTMASALLWMRHPPTLGVLGLALNACDERSNGHRAETDQMRELLPATRELWEHASRDGARRRSPPRAARSLPARPPGERAGRHDAG